MKRNFHQRLTSVLSTLAVCAATPVFASDFNIPFVNGADLGDLYSGWAAAADSASTAYTNPAGLALLEHPQVSLSGIGIMGSAKFTGTSSNPFIPGLTQAGSASSKLRGFLPTLYLASPRFHNFVFGFGASAPFALGTNYATNSVVRYAATRSQIAVVDLGPSVGYKIDEQWAVGAGIDFDRMTLTLNQMYGLPFAIPDANGQNHLAGWGWGWHGGVTYQALPSTRIGVSFNSMIAFQTAGDSEIFTRAAELRTTGQRADIRMPAHTQLSITHDFSKRLTAMATVFYTNWRTLHQITLKNTMLPTGTTASVTLPLRYHNTFDYAIGLKFQYNPKWLLRTGVEFLTTPSNNVNRFVADPFGCGMILGIGARYQQNPKLSYDLSYAHGFFQTTAINYASQVVTLSGHESQNTNVFAAQVNWNLA